MEETISLEASKELQDVMPDYTEYIWYDDTGYDASIYKNDDIFWYMKDSQKSKGENWPYKTLTLEEAIDMVPINKWYRNSIFENKKDSESSIEAVEKMLLYLHKKWLLTK